ncbi:MAG TPA: hypothetical protein DDW76_09655 [Cyanobacteria bacterium UBA11369]|nr:hypothetical protein [Cyanobacteria bacterium UBA11371]HBE34984.1 hypothetical protein [Cyanobacteria bacterium UBA11368]HBE49040.1 hypothetical protein [Cyanobacteria bacterium UBA11369]
MRKQLIQITLQLTGSMALGCLLSPAAGAQITSDGTLSTNVTTSDGINFTINEGNRAGGNLFHSFREFSVPTGGSAFFNNAADVQNIFSRVTGGTVSNIDGLIEANGGANLFLINPSGIIFGSNARLNIGGSFLATTASSLLFPEGEFSAVEPQTSSLLTVNLPVGLRFRENPGNIINKSVATIVTTNGGSLPVGLLVPTENTLALIGGNVTLDGGLLVAPGGRVELGGLAEPGIIALETNNNSLRLRFPENVARSNVSIAEKAIVFVAGTGGGNIAINARNLDVSGNSQIATGIFSNQGSAETKAGDIEINATENVKIDNSLITSRISDGAVGNAGNIIINTGSLVLTNIGQINSIVRGQGNTGNIIIQARDTVSVSGQNQRSDDNSAILTTFKSGSVGNTGEIQITARSLSVTDGAVIGTATQGRGSTGNIIIKVAESVLLSGIAPTRISTETLSQYSGNSGQITIEARSLSVSGGAQVSTSTSGQGNAGNIRIDAKDSVTLSGSDPISVTLSDGTSIQGESSGLLTSTEVLAQGKGGDIRVTTGSLRVQDGAVLSARTRSSARGGDINVEANTVEITGGGQLLTTAFNIGDAGNIVVNANDRVTIAGSDRTNSNRLTNDGNASGILVRSQIGVPDAGDAGTIVINTPTLRLDDQGTITAASASVNGGDVILRQLSLLVMRRNSSISASAGTAQAGGNGGNLNIDTGVLAALENSDIAANAFEGDGGRVDIAAQGIFGTQFRLQETLQSDITASSTFGRQGEVTLNTPDVDPRSGLVELPETVVDPDALIAQNPCTLGKASEFIVTGRGGLPPSPSEALSSRTVRVGLVEPVQPTATAAVTSRSSRAAVPPIVPEEEGQLLDQDGFVRSQEPIPAQGWIRNEKGEVILTSYDPTGTGANRLRSNPPTCPVR